MRALARLARLGREEGGNAFIELTLLMPLLVGLMCGLAEFGQILRQYHLMDKGVRDAARYMARADAEVCPSPDSDWTGAEAEARNLAIYGSVDGSRPLLRTWTDPDTVVITPECLANPPDATGARPWRGGDVIARVTVTATAPYADLGMLDFLQIAPPTLTVAHQQLVIGG